MTGTGRGDVAKVFVSHRGVDAAPAGRLADELRAAGHDVWLDADEIKVGDSVVEKIDAGLASLDVLVLCLSADDDGVHTTWMIREWAPALARQLAGHRVAILPVVLTGGRLPAVLADIKAADLVTDWKAGIGALLRAIAAIDANGRRPGTR
jgi:hypothetical protein